MDNTNPLSSPLPNEEQTLEEREFSGGRILRTTLATINTFSGGIAMTSTVKRPATGDCSCSSFTVADFVECLANCNRIVCLQKHYAGTCVSCGLPACTSCLKRAIFEGRENPGIIVQGLPQVIGYLMCVRCVAQFQPQPSIARFIYEKKKAELKAKIVGFLFKRFGL